MSTTPPLARHGLLPALLLAACTTAQAPRPAPLQRAVAARPATSPAAIFADVLSKVREQSVDEVSAGRLFAGALKGLESVPPKGAIRVTPDGRSARLTHGESGSAEAAISVSLPSTDAPVDTADALDEAARFTVERLGAKAPEVLDAMLRGLMSFDAAGSYIAPAAFTALQIPQGGAGVGLEVAIRRNVLTIVSPVAGGPGERAGLRTGDQIVSIDGTPTAGLGLPAAVDLLRGRVGSRAVVSVARAEWSGLREFVLTRELIPPPGVERKMLARVGYLRVRQLREETAGQVSSALDVLRAEGAQALVLDVRNSPGGLLTAAIEVAELFLEDHRLLTYTKGRIRNQNMRFSAHAKRPVLDLPLVVLVDDGTAAGSEIIGATLQDWGRATLVGTRTSGRTTIQTIIPLANGGALRLTTARWFTPKGRSLGGKGLTPDTEIAEDEGAERVLGDPERDAQLRRAISVLGAMSSR